MNPLVYLIIFAVAILIGVYPLSVYLQDRMYDKFARNLIFQLDQKFVVLCGSTRFLDQFDAASIRFTLDDWIVLSVGSHRYSDKNLGLIAEKKEQLDKLHKRKIEISDLVFIINVGGYIGNSTRSEIDYAKKLGKSIEYLEEIPDIESNDISDPMHAQGNDVRGLESKLQER